MFENGSLERDFTEAARWYQMAAEQGYVDAQMSLGSLHEYGRVSHSDGPDFPQNRAEAARWYRLASERGSADAQIALQRLAAASSRVGRNNEVRRERVSSQARWREVYRTRYGTRTLVDLQSVRTASNAVLRFAEVMEDASVDRTVAWRFSYSTAVVDCELRLMNIERKREVYRNGRSEGTASELSMGHVSSPLEISIFDAVCE
jgi:TPR repeat protein